MSQRLTSLRDENDPKHYCSQCADGEEEAQAELAQAYEEDMLEITEDVGEQECWN